MKISKREKIEKKKEKVQDKRKSLKRDDYKQYEMEEEAEEEEAEPFEEKTEILSSVAKDADYGARKYMEDEELVFDDMFEEEAKREREEVGDRDEEVSRQGRGFLRC